MGAIRKLRMLANEIDWHVYDNGGIPYDLRKIADEMEAENAKLRELCADMWRDIPKTESCGWDMSTNTCTGSDECIGECSYWYRMRNLGIEVNDE